MALEISSYVKRGKTVVRELKPVEDYLTPLRRKPPPRRSLNDGFERVARFFDRKIAQQESGD